MNNKGQTLVAFITLLPLLLIILSFVIDLGFLYIEKRNISNNTKDAVEYYLNNIDDADINKKVEKLLNENIKEIEDIHVNNTDSYVEITVIKNRKSKYSIIPVNNEINVTYKGMKNSKKIIKG